MQMHLVDRSSVVFKHAPAQSHIIWEIGGTHRGFREPDHLDASVGFPAVIRDRTRALLDVMWLIAVHEHRSDVRQKGGHNDIPIEIGIQYDWCRSLVAPTGSMAHSMRIDAVVWHIRLGSGSRGGMVARAPNWRARLTIWWRSGSLLQFLDLLRGRPVFHQQFIMVVSRFVSFTLQ
jgi:hypothetical protein